MNIGSISELAAALVTAQQNRRQAVFMIGAGCSMSAGIPLADEIVDYCRVVHHAAYAAAGDSHRYWTVMKRLPWQSRYALLHGLVNMASLNWAHLCLAMLLTERFVGRVMTTNFDDLALRACALQGLHPATHDLAVNADLRFSNRSDAAVPYRDALLREPAILFLHGRHNGFYQAHSEEQLRRQAILMRPVVAATKQKHRPWVIVGYSGSDPLFNTLCEGGFPGGLYWVNPSRPEGDALRALEAAHGHYIAAEADAFFLELVRRTIGGGRKILMPMLLHPASALSTLVTPTGPQAPSTPSVAGLKRALDLAFRDPRRLSMHAARAAHARDPERDTAWAAIESGERALAMARADPTATRHAWAKAYKAFTAAATALCSRNDALADWQQALTSSPGDEQVAATRWRRIYERYRQADQLEYLLAWAEGRAASVLAWRAQLGIASAHQLRERRTRVERMGAYMQPSMALHLGIGDLRLVDARLRAAGTDRSGPGDKLLRAAFDDFEQARRLAVADYPENFPRAAAMRSLGRKPSRSARQAPTFDTVQRLRDRISEASGL